MTELEKIREEVRELRDRLCDHTYEIDNKNMHKAFSGFLKTICALTDEIEKGE